MLNLTPNQKRVLILIGEGYNVRGISARMYRSQTGVWYYIDQICTKAGITRSDPEVHTWARLVRLADDVRAEDKEKADALSNEFAAKLISYRQATAKEMAG